jgi:hypothetical protein
MDASISHLWRGAAADGNDYRRACEVFDTSPQVEGKELSIGDKAGMLWEMRGAGTADAFFNGHLVIIRTWPADPFDKTAPLKLATEPMANRSELGELRIVTGTLLILWAAENGSCVESISIPLNGRPTGDMALNTGGLLIQMKNGLYRCFHDEIETNLGDARRLHLIAP